MLIISRKQGDSLLIDTGSEQIEITITETGKQVRLGITAPEGCKIWRKELYQTMQENRQAVGERRQGDLRQMLRNFQKPSAQTKK